MIAMACEALEAVGIKRGGYKVFVSDRRLLDALLEALGLEDVAPKRMKVLRAIDKWDRLGDEGVRLLLGKGRKDESGDFTPGAELAGEQIKQVVDFVDTKTAFEGTPAQYLDRLRAFNLARTATGVAALNDMTQIAAALEALGVGADRYQFDTSVVRGLEYYTGAVFEAQLVGADGTSFGSVGGGGRYDDLVARFRGDRVPATGFSVGVSRLVAALDVANAAASESEGPVVILALEADRMTDYFAMAAELRGAGVRAEVYLGGSGMRAQMKYADKRGAPLAVIVGGDERAKGVVTVKDLKLGAEMSKSITDNEEWRKGRPAQIEAPRGELVATVKKMLAGHE